MLPLVHSCPEETSRGDTAHLPPDLAALTLFSEGLGSAATPKQLAEPLTWL